MIRDPHRWLRYGLCLAAAGLPLGAYNGPVCTFTMTKLVVLSLAVLVGSVGVAAAAFGAEGRQAASSAAILRPRRSRLDLPVLAVLAVLAASTALSEDPLLSFTGMYNYYANGFWPLAMAACLFFLASWADEASVQWVRLALMAAAGAVGGYAVLQLGGWDPFPSLRWVLLGSRPVSTLGSPVSLGSLMAMTAPLCLQSALRPGPRERALGWACLVLCLAGLLVSGTRAGFIGALCGGAAFMALSGMGLPSSRKGRAALALVLLSMAGFLAWRIAVRIRTRELVEVDTARVEIWRIAWRAFKAAGSPWTGTGPDTFELQFRRNKTEDYVKATSTVEYQAHAHNDILQVLVTTGLLGLAAYLWLLAAMAWECRRSLADPEARAWAAVSGSGVLALFVCSKFNPVPLETLSTAALLAGCMAGSRSRPEAELERKRPGRLLAAVLLLFGSASVYLSSRLAAADSRLNDAKVSGPYQPHKSLRRFESALALNPCEVSYHAAFINQLTSRAGQVPDQASKAALLDRASASGRKAVSCHPRSSLAHFCLGAAELAQASFGRMDRLALAEEELDRAHELDPNFFNILEVRLKAALLRGDRLKAESLIRRLQYLYALPRRQVTP